VSPRGASQFFFFPVIKFRCVWLYFFLFSLIRRAKKQKKRKKKKKKKKIFVDRNRFRTYVSEIFHLKIFPIILTWKVRFRFKFGTSASRSVLKRVNRIFFNRLDYLKFFLFFLSTFFFVLHWNFNVCVSSGALTLISKMQSKKFINLLSSMDFFIN
jgi:hypothetical protein